VRTFYHYLSIFKTFNEKKINYIVVGGMAVNLHGIPRMTYDIDLILSLKDKNLKNFLELMTEWGFKPKVPVKMMELAIKQKRQDWIKNKNMKAFNFVNPDWELSEIDIIIDSPIDYERAIKNVTKLKLENIAIPLISIKDLIKMKRVSGRAQDKADIANLNKILKT